MKNRGNFVLQTCHPKIFSKSSHELFAASLKHEWAETQCKIKMVQKSMLRRTSVFGVKYFGGFSASDFKGRRPPKQPPTQKKQFAQTVCVNSFCLFSANFKGKRGHNLYKLSRKVLRQLCIGDAAFLLAIGSFLLRIDLLCLQLCLGVFSYSFTFFTYS